MHEFITSQLPSYSLFAQSAPKSASWFGELGPYNWSILLVYMAATFGLGVYASRHQKSQADYFFAGRATPPLIAAISLFATLFSTNSFVAVPGEAYGHGALFFLSSIGYALFTPLAVWLFLKFFYGRGDSNTIYEYLETRFDVRTRLLASIVFTLGRVLWGATAFFAGAKLFNAMTGWSHESTILVMGIFTIAYTTIGGMRGVMLTDVMQTVVIFTGVGVIWFTLSKLIGHDYAGMWSYASQNGHGFGRLFEADFYKVDLYERYCFWQFLFVYGMLRPLQDYGTDQLVVQRLLSSNSYAAAKRAVWTKTLMSIPLMATFYIVGLLLFYYYGSFAESHRSPDKDKVLFEFITTMLPAPLPGLIAAAALAALMSSVSSVISSLSTVTCIDYIQRFTSREIPEPRKVWLAKAFTVVWGIIILAIALWLSQMDEKNSINELAQIVASLAGVLLVVVIAGTRTRWATANAAAYALGIGLAVGVGYTYYYLQTPEGVKRISFGWVGIPGLAVTAVLVAAISAVENTIRKRTVG